MAIFISIIFIHAQFNKIFPTILDSLPFLPDTHSHSKSCMSIYSPKCFLQQLTKRNWSVSTKYQVERINQLIRGWVNYFRVGYISLTAWSRLSFSSILSSNFLSCILVNSFPSRRSVSTLSRFVSGLFPSPIEISITIKLFSPSLFQTFV